MNTKLSLTAITLFAVTMGIGFLTPALAAPLPKSDVCHFEEEEIIPTDSNGDGVIDEFDTPIVVPAEWKVININDNALSAHLDRHGVAGNFDQLIDDSATPAANTVSTTDCLARATA